MPDRQYPNRSFEEHISDLAGLALVTNRMAESTRKDLKA